MLLEVLMTLGIIALVLLPLVSGMSLLLERLDREAERTRLRLELLDLLASLRFEVEGEHWLAIVDDVEIRVTSPPEVLHSQVTEPQSPPGRRRGVPPDWRWRLRAVPGDEVDRLVIEAWTERVRVARRIPLVRP